jgi:hypothetical protein
MLNADLKSLLLLWEYLARNQRYANFVEERDIDTVFNRVAHEGLQFLTVVLPGLGRAIDKFHSTNVWTLPEGFKAKGDGRSVFLQKAIDASLEGNSVAVDCVRQLTYVFYKLEVPHDEEKTEEFLQSFIRTDRDLLRFSFRPGDWCEGGAHNERPSRPIYARALVERMQGLVSDVLYKQDPLDIRPCHGGGATACHTPNHEKWHKLRYYPELDTIYDYATYFFFSSTHLVDELESLLSSPHAVPQARVCLVPKDSRGPRVISCEPAELMYIQQGLMRKLYGVLESHPLTRGQINFTDQGINRELAHLGSLGGPYATLDLKDASDRVSLGLIRRVFPVDWVACLEACRSKTTLLPNGELVELNKFAPMGSSCCFPVEALVFWACARAAIDLQLQADRKTAAVHVTHYRGVAVAGCRCSVYDLPEHWVVQDIGEGEKPSSVYVYGDDIICDPRFATCVMEALELVGLLVNRDKSFVSGPFRESCGGDFHKGMDVTPLRLRNWFDKSSTRLQQISDFCNESIAKFGYESSHKMITFLEGVVGYSYPRTLLPLPLTVRGEYAALNDAHFVRRWNLHLQRYEHRVLTSVCLPKRRQPPNWGELMRKELSREHRSLDQGDRYVNELQMLNAKTDPGEYVDLHTTRTTWKWCWLG